MIDPDEESKELAEPPTSLVQVRVGNREFSMVKSSRCGVCMHPARFAIEEKLMLNYGYPAIVRFVSEHVVQKDDGTTEQWPKLTPIQIRHHRQAGHVAITGEMAEEFVRRRAEATGFDIETSTGQLIDRHIINDVILQRGFEALVKGEIVPDVKDLNAALKLQADLEAANNKTQGAEDYQELMALFFRSVQKRVDADTFKAIMGDIQHNTTFKQIQQRRTIEGNT